MAPAVGWGVAAGVRGERRKASAPDVGERPFRPVEEAGEIEVEPAQSAKRSRARHGLCTTPRPCGRRGAEGHEGHHVDGTQPGMDPDMGAQVDGGHGRRGHGPGRVLDRLQRAARGSGPSGGARGRSGRRAGGPRRPTARASMTGRSRPSLMLMTHSASVPGAGTSAAPTRCVRRRRRDRPGGDAACDGAHARTCRPTRRDRPAPRGRTAGRPRPPGTRHRCAGRPARRRRHSERRSAGDMSLHFPTLIHSVSMIPPSISRRLRWVSACGANPGAAAFRCATSLAFRTLLQCEMGRY